MKFKPNALLAASLIALAGSSAHAALNLPGASSFGNSSLLFVAIDTNDTISFAADLGVNMAAFIPGSTLLNAGSNVTWNFTDNTVAGAAITGNAWSDAFSTFKSTATGNDYRWGVIAADSISGTIDPASNVIAGRGWMATGNPTPTQMLNASTSGPTGNGLTALNNFYAATNNLGTFISATNGAGTTTSGAAYGAMGGNFNGFNTWNYLLGDGATSNFQYQQQVTADPTVFQLGAPSATDSLSTNPATFRFDIATGQLNYSVAAVTAVPEPESYAMMIAGLALIGSFVARRRKA